jgi:hypothetical protein
MRTLADQRTVELGALDADAAQVQQRRPSRTMLGSSISPR